uniref:ubiquitin conjugation factor E4 A isoform X2 n=1 Tax=Myxine glutinosa TaxID=7769 RepID=UPI00358EB30C
MRHFFTSRGMTDAKNNNLKENPFAGLFPSLGQAQDFRFLQRSTVRTSIAGLPLLPDPSSSSSLSSWDDRSGEDEEVKGENKCDEDSFLKAFLNEHESSGQANITHLLQRVFLFTPHSPEEGLAAGKGVPPCLVYLPEIGIEPGGETWLGVHNLERAVFSRLLMPSPEEQLVWLDDGSVPEGGTGRRIGMHAAEEEATEKAAILYLFSSFVRARDEACHVPHSLLSCVERCQKVCAVQAGTALLTSGLLFDQSPPHQLLQVLLTGGAKGWDFMTAVLDTLGAGEAQSGGEMQDAEAVNEALIPVLDVVVKDLKGLRLESPQLEPLLELLLTWSRKPILAQVLMEHLGSSTLSGSASSFSSSLLGLALSPSAIPSPLSLSPSAFPLSLTLPQSEYFPHPTQLSPLEVQAQKSRVHELISRLHGCVSGIIRSLLQNQTTRRHLLTWLGNFLHANGPHRTLWASQAPVVTLSSDACLLNLAGVLVRLCRPFSQPGCHLLPTFDPLYCLATGLPLEERQQKGVHMKGLDKETPFLPRGTVSPDFPPSFNMLTEVFHMAQFSLGVVLHRLIASLLNLYRDLQRLRVAWQQAQGGSPGPGSFGSSGSHAEGRLKERFQSALGAWLALEASVMEPHFVQNTIGLQLATATLGVQLAVGWERRRDGVVDVPDARAIGGMVERKEDQNSGEVGMVLSNEQGLIRKTTGSSGKKPEMNEGHLQEAPGTDMKSDGCGLGGEEERFQKDMERELDAQEDTLIGIGVKTSPEFVSVCFPLLPVSCSSMLPCFLELFADNLVDCLVMAGRFSPETMEQSPACLPYFLNFICAFMGSPDRMSNPHLRARLAEVLEALLPPVDPTDSEPGTAPPAPSFARAQAFSQYTHPAALTRALLLVFVDIEFTGDPHQFEQKFNYRRPMYPILRRMWDTASYESTVTDLVNDAIEQMEAAPAPLLLRFLNILLNDATFLLDEAIQYLSQIKVRQQDMEEESEVPAGERRSSLQQLIQLARFHNVMALETLHTLACITPGVRMILVHPIMSDRVIAMLNHFLQHLAGPRARHLKVRDFAELEFKPQDLLRYIISTYVGLGQAESFCAAVSRDERSYSHQLLLRAAKVLERVQPDPTLNASFLELVHRVQTLAEQQEKESECWADSPDDFLDPILSTLMLDPVILPSSRVSVDRATIARHLLSDPTDPFNRTPLSMEQVKPDSELKQRIASWLHDKKMKNK